MYNTENIADCIKTVLKQKNIKLNIMLRELNLGVNFVSQIKKGAVPSSETIYRIAEYLDVSTDYLLGKETQKKENAKSVLTKDQKKAFDIITALTSERLDKAIDYANYLLTEQNKNKD